jgi:diguanylate cyclase (GGDEF)-like protein/PAS domain S-box-containing protein
MRDQPQPLNTALWGLLWKRLMLPYLTAMFVIMCLTAYYGGVLVESQQLRNSRLISYTASSFLVDAGNELDSLAAIVSTGNLELIDLSIKTKQVSHGIFDTIYVLDSAKKITTLMPFDERYVGLDMSRRSYFDSLDCETGVNFSIPFTSLRTGEPTAYLLRCTDSGSYLVGELNLGALQDAIQAVASPLDGMVFIVDQTGTLLAHPDPQLVAQHVNIANWPVVVQGLNQQDSTVRYWRDGNFLMGSASLISPTHWLVVSEVPALNVYLPYFGLLVILILVLILIFSISVRVFLGQLQQKLVIPLMHLSESADALANGNYVLSDAVGDDNISYLEINNLLADFQKMSRAIIGRESLLKQSEEQYRRLLEHSPNAILLHRNSIIIYANASAIELFAAEGMIDFVNKSVLDLVHPDSRPLVQSRLHKLREKEQILPLVEQKQVRFDQSVFHAEVVTSSVFFAGDYVAQTIVRDITERKNEEDALRHRATHDPLTELPNRFLFQDRLEHALSKTKRNKTFGAVLYLDLDGFKSINDAFGHGVGDQVLQYVSKSLCTSLREDDTVARLGGDEFVVLLDTIMHPEDAEHVADNILRAFSKPYHVAGKEILISFSIGISIFPDDGVDVNILLQSSDEAMYRAKLEGKRQIKYFTPQMRQQSLERIQIQTELNHALELDQLFLLYQPEVNCETGEIMAVEALLRWRHPELGLVSPGKFIPVAEDTGLILSIGKWVLRTACEQAQQWSSRGIRTAVNLSNLQLKQTQITQTIQEAIDDFGLSPELLEIELTENIVFQDADASSNDLNRLKSLGVSLAMDDFGAGYSTLGYLAHLPFDRIKIDQRLVSNIHDQKDAAVVSGIIAICNNLDLDIVAEGVETAEQLLFCTSKECKYIQGWYYSRAVESSTIMDYLTNGYPWKNGNEDVGK